MKKIWNFVKNFIIFVYILLIIFVTICLLSYNDYKITEFGRQSLIPIIDENLEPDYSVGDLLIVEKNRFSTLNKGDVIFFYRTFAGETTINFAKITNIERVSDTEFTFTVEGDYRFSSTYYIGKAETATIVPYVGRILGILESKWGFLFLGVFPSLVAFLYTLYSVVAEVRGYDEEEVIEKPKKKKKTTPSNNTTTTKPKNNSEEKTKKPKVEETKVEEPKVEISEKENKSDVKENSEVVKKEKNEDINPIINSDEDEKGNENPIKEKVKSKTEDVIQEKKSNSKQMTEEQRKALIEEKMKNMTEEQKKALIEAKLKSMTEEQKKALIEAKKKKMQEQKNNK